MDAAFFFTRYVRVCVALFVTYYYYWNYYCYWYIILLIVAIVVLLLLLLLLLVLFVVAIVRYGLRQYRRYEWVLLYCLTSI